MLRAAIHQTLFRQNVSRENSSNFNDIKLSQYTVHNVLATLSSYIHTLAIKHTNVLAYMECTASWSPCITPTTVPLLVFCTHPFSDLSTACFSVCYNIIITKAPLSLITHLPEENSYSEHI